LALAVRTRGRGESVTIGGLAAEAATDLPPAEGGRFIGRNGRLLSAAHCNAGPALARAVAWLREGSGGGVPSAVTRRT